LQASRYRKSAAAVPRRRFRLLGMMLTSVALGRNSQAIHCTPHAYPGCGPGSPARAPSPKGERLLSTVKPRERGLVQSMEMQLEPDEGWRDICASAQVVHVERIDRENVMMRRIALRWTGPPPTRGAEISAALNAAGRCKLARRISGVLGQSCCARGDIEYDPVPPATAGGGIRIINGEGQALGSCGRPAPIEGWRDVLPGAAKSFEDLFVADGGPRLNIRAGNGHSTRSCADRCQQQSKAQGAQHCTSHG